jgi:CBS domain containing-hemolysin-like protein
MIPRADVVHLSVGDSVRQALETANLTGYSRIPVLTSDGNDSPGFIAAKDVLRLYREGRVEEPVDNHLRPITFVPETKRILELLDEFRKGRRQIALVIDEFGSMVGVVTLEDLLEEILGEIYDEYDTDAAEAKWDKGMFVIPGSFPVAKLAQGLKARLPEGEFDTAAGLFLHLLGRIPTPGEAVALDNGWELVATHLAGHRITRLLARRTGPPGVTG